MFVVPSRYLLSMYKTHLNLIKQLGGQIGGAIRNGNSNSRTSKGYKIGVKGPRGWWTFLKFYLLRTFNLCYLVTIYPLKFKREMLALVLNVIGV